MKLLLSIIFSTISVFSSTAQSVGKNNSNQGTSSLISDFIVNDDSGTNKPQHIPVIAVNDSGVFVIVWQDYRTYPKKNYFAQWYSPDGSKRGINKKINEIDNMAGQVKPQAAINKKGETVVVWEDFRAGSGSSDIYFQRYDGSGNAKGANVRVNESIGTGQRTSPDVAIDSSGNFVVVWTGTGINSLDIWRQKYNSSGAKVGINTLVNDDGTNKDQGDPAIAITESGNYVISWFDIRSGTNVDIYAMRFGGLAGGPTGNFIVNDDLGTTHQRNPDVGIDETGSFTIVWDDERNGNKDIYAQRYTSTGITSGSNWKVNNNSASTDESYPSIGVDKSGNSIIAWQDFRDSKKEHIFSQRYSSNGSSVESNLKTTLSDTSHQIRISIKLWNSRIYSAWENTKGPISTEDIVCSVLDWNSPFTSVDSKNRAVPNSVELLQNYPNPFNPSTSINYSLTTGGHVLVAVYDLSGRMVGMLVNEQKSAGHYSLVFEGNKLSSGIYICRLETPFSVKSIKLCLVK